MSITLKTQKNWLKVSAFAIFSFAPVFFFGAIPETSYPAALTLDILSFPLDNNMDYSHPSTRFLSALTSGFLFGWGVLVWLLSSSIFDKSPNEVRKAVIFSILCWFVVDSTGSFFSGNGSNVFFNILVLLVGIGPLYKRVSA